MDDTGMAASGPAANRLHEVVVELTNDKDRLCITGVICPDSGPDRRCGVHEETQDSYPDEPDSEIPDRAAKRYGPTYDHGFVESDEVVALEWQRYEEDLDNYEPWSPVDACWVAAAALGTYDQFEWDEGWQGETRPTEPGRYLADWRNEGDMEDSWLLLTLVRRVDARDRH